ncbi:MAG TPA: hypothetical protein VGH19_05245 [Verrucomicrobiae bacterium]
METNPYYRLRKWSVRVTAVFIGLMLLAIITGTALRSRQPDLPSDWRQLYAGMSRVQIEATIPDSLHDWRDMKGFDAASRTMSGNYVWNINIYYDSQGRASGADIRLVHLQYGFLGRGIEKLF